MPTSNDATTPSSPAFTLRASISDFCLSDWGDVRFSAESEKHKDSLSYQRASINSSDDLHNPQPLYAHQHQPNASVSSLRNEVEPEPGSYVEKQYAGAGAYYSDERAEQQGYGDAPQQNPARWQPQTQAMGSGYRVRNQEAHPSLRPAQGAYDPFAAQQQQQSYGTGYVPDDYTEASYYRQHWGSSRVGAWTIWW
jgi:hypothetical protein